MARKKNGEKTGSDHIRDYYGLHRRAKPSEVVAGLAEQGIVVKTQLVSNVRARMKKKRRPGRPKGSKNKVGRKARRVVVRSTSMSVDQLLDAKKLVDQLGGAAAVRKALDMLDQFR